jgi:hypothetical protein
MAIFIDSAGYVETYRRLSEKIGVNLGKVHQDMNRLLDVRKLYIRKYRKRLVVRTKKKLIFLEAADPGNEDGKREPEELTIRIRHQRILRGRLANGRDTNKDTNEDCNNREQQSRDEWKKSGLCTVGLQANFFKRLFEK